MLMGKEYRKYANACMELAKTAKSETEREVLSDFARSWLQAAVNAESSDECKLRTNHCGQGKIGNLIQSFGLAEWKGSSRCSMSATSRRTRRRTDASFAAYPRDTTNAACSLRRLARTQVFY